MTVKRDFKRRVRQRQERTGESYVTARRHLLDSRPSAEAEAEPDDDGDDDDDDDDGAEDPPGRGISVVELLDVTDEARRIGLACRVLMFPSLSERIAPDRVLAHLHDLLVATAGDPATARLARLALSGVVLEPPRPVLLDTDALRRFIRRARAGLGGTLNDGSTLAFHLPDASGLVPILCALSARGEAIELSAIDSVLPDPWGPLAPLLALERSQPGGGARSRDVVQDLTSALLGIGRVKAPWPLLCALYNGRRYPVIRAPFVIGRSAACDLLLDGEGEPAEHAAVILRDDAAYIKDLGLEDGVVYRGMRIDNKRIQEGDVFVICGQEISFTFIEG